MGNLGLCWIVRMAHASQSVDMCFFEKPEKSVDYSFLRMGRRILGLSLVLRHEAGAEFRSNRQCACREKFGLGKSPVLLSSRLVYDQS